MLKAGTSIRTAEQNDSPAIAQVHVASWQEAYRTILPDEFLSQLSVEKRRVMWADSIARDLPHVLVAESDGQVLGFSAIGPCRDLGSIATCFEVWAIYVAPSHWSCGVGRELWLASQSVAQERGASMITLWAIAKNERAIKFYQKAGFEREPSSLKSIMLGETQVDEIRYVRKIES